MEFIIIGIVLYLIATRKTTETKSIKPTYDINKIKNVNKKGLPSGDQSK